MKKILKLFLLLVVAFTTVSLTSCLNDDEESVYTNLTDTQKQNAILKAEGGYSGKLYYFKYNPSSIYRVSQDSVSTYFSLIAAHEAAADTITSANITTSFPVRILASFAGTDSTIVKNCPNLPLTGKASMYDQQYKTYVEQDAYMYYMDFGTTLTGQDSNNNTITVKLLNDQNLIFLNSSYTPIMMTFNNQVSGYILVESIKVNGNEHQIKAPIAIVGKK